MGYTSAREPREPEDHLTRNSNNPDVSPEDADHWIAETLGGTSRSSKSVPDRLLPHKAVPDHNGYCKADIGGGELCELDKSNPIHTTDSRGRAVGGGSGGGGSWSAGVVAAGPTHPAKFGCGITHRGRVEDCRSCSHYMIEPHEAMCPVGVLGGSCLKCGQVAGHPIHNVGTYARKTTTWSAKEPDPLPLGEIRVGAIDDRVAGVYRLEVENIPTEEARRILIDVLPGILELFLKKNKDYGDSAHTRSLGAKAEFVRMWNKMAKLKRGLWDGEPLDGEQPDEIMADLIGHLLLALDRAEG